MSSLYDLMIDKIGSAENFIKELCDKNGVDYNQPINQESTQHKCKTIDELISDLESCKANIGGDALVYAEDSSGYEYEIKLCCEGDGLFIVLG